MVDNTSAVGNDCHPRVVPQLINGCQLSRGRDRSLWIQSLVEFLIFSGHLCPPIKAVPDGLVMTTTTTTTMVFLSPDRHHQVTSEVIKNGKTSYCDFLRYLLSCPRPASSITNMTLSVLQTPINRTMNSLLRFAISFASRINSAFNQQH